MKKTKWFIYSLFVGLIPFIARFCVFLTISIKDINFLLNPIDFIVLGLVLNITNINELESYKSNDEKWKTRSIGFSVIFIILYGIFLAISALIEVSPGLFDLKLIQFISIGFSLTSCLFGYSIFDRITKMEEKKC